MNKTMEYMSYALPVVTFDLSETRVSAAEAALYVEPSDDPATTFVDAERYAKAIAELLDDPRSRGEMAVAAPRRAEATLDWEPQRRRYVGVYDRDCSAYRLALGPQRAQSKDHPFDADSFVGVADREALRRFTRHRRIRKTRLYRGGRKTDHGPQEADRIDTGQAQ